MTRTLDSIMEEASGALMRMDYLASEALCLEALAAARLQGDWAYYARILMPLQEVRRQRRMIAAEGVVRLGSSDLPGDLSGYLGTLEAGCLVVTHPHSRDDARALVDAARQQRKHIEVIFADSPVTSDAWMLRSFAGPDITCRMPVPPKAWIDRAFIGGRVPGPIGGPAFKHQPGAQPADWFIDASEALGDAALLWVGSPHGLERLEALEQCLQVVSDHEILHQRLADAARTLALRNA